MKIKSRKLKKLLWEARRYAIIIAFYAVAFFMTAYIICLILTLPEIIVSMIYD